MVDSKMQALSDLERLGHLNRLHIRNRLSPSEVTERDSLREKFGDAGRNDHTSQNAWTTWLLDHGMTP